MKIPAFFQSSVLTSATLGLALFLAAACDETNASAEAGEGEALLEDYGERARAAALVDGECQPEDCGAQASAGSCWCDAACAAFGDCCDNKASVCNMPDVSDFCGGIAGISCAEGLVCVQDPGTCNVADAGGTCQIDTDICLNVYLPVCGCDGNTYGNACKAQVAGVTVDYAGECESDAASCEGHCGGPTAAGCWCDNQCTTWGDCCPDYEDLCASESVTRRGY